MKTYILNRGYDNDYRVTVADDVNFWADSNQGDDGMRVVFSEPVSGEKYQSNTVAAFSSVKAVYPEDNSVVVEQKVFKYDVAAKAVTCDETAVVSWEKV